MRKRALPATLQAARAELDRLMKRMRADKQRAEAVLEVVRDLHNGHKLPAVGSRWVRTQDLGLRNRKPLQSVYTFVAYVYPEVGSPVYVLVGDGNRGQHSSVSAETFAREFDPVPAAAAKRRRA